MLQLNQAGVSPLDDIIIVGRGNDSDSTEC